jgi:outer membrane protein assembly factor BamB
MPTENTIITNQFVNNISKNKNDLFYLNSYGSLYSFDAFNMKLNWFINLSPSLNLDQSNLFYGSEVVTAGNNIIVSSNYNTYLINKKNGFILNKFNFSSVIKPIINNNIGFLVTKNNLLIAINLVNAEILYSRDINLQVAKSLNSKKKNLNFKNLMLLNNNLFLFLKNSFVLHFRNNGELIEIKKLPSKINTLPILIDSSILYLNFKNKLIVVN